MEWVVMVAFVALGATFVYIVYDMDRHFKKGKI